MESSSSCISSMHVHEFCLTNRYYVGHKGKFGHEFLEFEFRPNGIVTSEEYLISTELFPFPTRGSLMTYSLAIIL